MFWCLQPSIFQNTKSQGVFDEQMEINSQMHKNNDSNINCSRYNVISVVRVLVHVCHISSLCVMRPTSLIIITAINCDSNKSAACTSIGYILMGRVIVTRRLIKMKELHGAAPRREGDQIWKWLFCLNLVTGGSGCFKVDLKMNPLDLAPVSS